MRKSLRLLLVMMVLGGATYWLHHRRVAHVEASATKSVAAASQEKPPVSKVAKELPVEALAPPTTAASAEHPKIRTLLAHFATGDFLGTLKLADEYALDPSLGDAFHDWLRAQMPAILTSAGWAHLRVGDCDAAIALLRRSEALQRSEDTAKGLGVCHYKLRQMAAARDQLTWYLERRPNDRQIPVLLADTLESEGRYDEAVQILEQLAQTPCDAAAAQDNECPAPNVIEQRLASMRGRARESWLQQQDSSRSFRLVYRAGDHEDLVAYVLQELEDALDEYVENYGFRLPGAPIEVALYPADNFQSVVVGGPEWAEGLYDGRIRIPIRDQMLLDKTYDGLRTVLRHELVHALFAAMSDHRAIPPWFDEGLAQVLSCRPSCVSFVFPPQAGAFLDVASFQSSYISFNPVKAGRAYRQSLYLVRSLIQRAGDEVLRKLVSSIGTASDLSSDHLLAPAGISFKDLHTSAAKAWEQRVPL